MTAMLAGRKASAARESNRHREDRRKRPREGEREENRAGQEE
jgi:hypothetical protein